MDNCGNCAHYREAPMQGPMCKKTGKPVSYLRANNPCWTEPGSPDAPKVATKVCNRCHRELPVTRFSRKSTEKDGYQRQCKDCQRELAHQLYTRRKEENLKEDLQPEQPKTTKVCAKCHRELPLDRFGNNKKSLDGKKSYCKDCENENCRKYREKVRRPRKPKVKSTALEQPPINNLLEGRAVSAEELTFAQALRELIAYGSITIKISLSKSNSK